MTIEEIEKEIIDLKSEVAALDAKHAVVNLNQARFLDASKILVELSRKAERCAVQHQERLAKLEEQGDSFVGFAQATDGRLDSVEESALHTDARLDALIDSQIHTEKQIAALGVHVSELATQTKESFSQLETFLAETARQVRALVEKQNGSNGKPRGDQ